MATGVNRVLAPSILVSSGVSEVAEKLRQITVLVRGGEGGGAGVIWRCDGLIVTNAHVAPGRAALIALHDGRTLRGEVVRRDTRLDLALLRTAASGLRSAELRDSATLRPGELVIAAGNPLGEVGAMSTGIVHCATDRYWVQADIRLSPGNSGGPLADATGRVVGINSMVVNGMGLAVSTGALERFLQAAA